MSLPKDLDPRDARYVELVTRRAEGASEEDIASAMEFDSPEDLYRRLAWDGFPICAWYGVAFVGEDHCAPAEEHRQQERRALYVGGVLITTTFRVWRPTGWRNSPAWGYRPTGENGGKGGLPAGRGVRRRWRRTAGASAQWRDTPCSFRCLPKRARMPADAAIRHATPHPPGHPRRDQHPRRGRRTRRRGGRRRQDTPGAPAAVRAARRFRGAFA